MVRDYVLPDYTHIKRGYVKVSGITFKFFVDCGGCIYDKTLYLKQRSDGLDNGLFKE